METYIIKSMIRVVYFIMLAAILVACSNKSNNYATPVILSADEMGDSVNLIIPEYATGFTVSYLSSGVRLVDVQDPQKDVEVDDDDEKEVEKGMPLEYHLALVPKGSDAKVPDGYTRVEVPIERVICMTALQLSNFTILDAHEEVVGLTGTKNLYNEDILRRVDDGKIVKIGMEGNFDTEKVLAANPDIIFISPFKKGGYETLKETGITLIPHLGYKELDPLGQAEWLKYVSMFLGKEEQANSIFYGIKKRYEDIKALTATIDNRPTVFSGEMHGGNWYALGGRNYLAQMFYDAGAKYVLSDDKHSGGLHIDFENMYLRAADADYWRILNSFPGDFSYAALKASNPRNADFKAFKEHKVIYCNMKQSPYYEITPVSPDVLLMDLVHIFHPGLLPPDYKPSFYHLLEE